MTTAPQDRFDRLLAFVARLTEARLHHRLSSVRPEAVMVEIAVPGQRWEVEFLADGTVEVEKFVSDGRMYDADELEVLWRDFTDSGGQPTLRTRLLRGYSTAEVHDIGELDVAHCRFGPDPIALRRRQSQFLSEVIATFAR